MAEPYAIDYAEVKWRMRQEFGMVRAVGSPHATLKLMNIDCGPVLTWFERFASELRALTGSWGPGDPRVTSGLGYQRVRIGGGV